jgi:glucose/mannose-6-phosphate isomerase
METNDLDRSNLREVILNYPNQLQLGQKFAASIRLPKKNYTDLIICGMGGSALPADLLTSYLSENSNFKLPIIINRSYDFPKKKGKEPLIFICSYSGNTEETVGCFSQALETKNQIVAFAKGGKIKDLAEKNKVPLVKMNIKFKNFQPRYATTYVFVSMHQVLTNIGLCDRINQFPKIDSRSLEVFGEELAQKIKGKTPVIYASDKYKLLAKNWKIKINENAKTPAFWNYLPELNHNEMISFTNPQSPFIAFFLIDDNDHSQIKKRAKITAELYRKKGVSTEIIKIKGKSYLEKTLNCLVLGDWASYYLALEYGQDPTPVEMVEELKKKLK